MLIMLLMILVLPVISLRIINHLSEQDDNPEREFGVRGISTGVPYGMLRLYQPFY